METKFTKSTDTKHKVKLEPKLIFAEWRSSSAPIGQKAAFAIGTLFVGEGAAVEVKGKSKKGKNLGSIMGKMRGNRLAGEFPIPTTVQIGDLVYFEVKLSSNGLSGESEKIAAAPPIKVSNLNWSASEARRGDVLTLKAKVEDAPSEAAAKVIIYEHDQDSAHDLIVEIPTIVMNNKIELQWEYQYHEDTDEIPTEEQMSRYGRSYNPPEYFFTVKIENNEFGKEDQASGLLEFKDWIEITLKKPDGTVRADEPFTITLPDGTAQDGQLDGEGRAKLENIPPGRCTVKFKNVKGIELSVS